jgi:hypothetical protein
VKAEKALQIQMIDIYKFRLKSGIEAETQLFELVLRYLADGAKPGASPDPERRVVGYTFF